MLSKLQSDNHELQLGMSCSENSELGIAEVSPSQVDWFYWGANECYLRPV